MTDLIDRYWILVPVALFQYLICGLYLTIALFASIFVYLGLLEVFVFSTTKHDELKVEEEIKK